MGRKTDIAQEGLGNGAGEAVMTSRPLRIHELMATVKENSKRLHRSIFGTQKVASLEAIHFYSTR
jgi:hypothetical protein